MKKVPKFEQLDESKLRMIGWAAFFFILGWYVARFVIPEDRGAVILAIPKEGKR